MVDIGIKKLLFLIYQTDKYLKDYDVHVGKDGRKSDSHTLLVGVSYGQDFHGADFLISFKI